MRQYGVILIAMVVLIAGYVARRQLAVPAASAEVVQARAAALQAAEGLSAALKAGARAPEELEDARAEALRRCEALAAMPGAGSCGPLRGQLEALQRAAQNASIGESTVADIEASVAALRGELQQR